MEISSVAARILGCLLEKGRTTPDQYPLSLNALVTACNQSTNRSPVVTYSEGTVEAGLDELRTLELVRREKPFGGRAIKYSELLVRSLPMGKPELALMGVLLLRGAQTPGELKARTERLYAFATLESLDEALGRLALHEDGPLVEQLHREPGHKEARWRECLSTPTTGSTGPTGDPMPAGQSVAPDVAEVTHVAGLVGRVATLEAEVTRLAAALDRLASEARD